MVLTAAANTATGAVVVVDGGVVRVVVVSRTVVGEPTAVEAVVAGVDVVELPPVGADPAVRLTDVAWGAVAFPDAPLPHDAPAPAAVRRTAASRYRLRGPRARLG
jgi:hypothetical protein